MISEGPQRPSPPNLVHVARHAGVSTATVSNVINHPHKVAPATRDRVEAVIEALGYTPNQNAKSLKAGASNTIGLVLFELTNSLFIDIARGVQREVRKHGLNLQIGSSDNDGAQQDEHVAFFDRSRVAGIILAPMFDSSGVIARVRRHARPVVVVNYRSADDSVCTVLVDNERAGYMAMAHLIELGCTRIAFVGGRWNLQPVSDRRRGAERAVVDAGGAVSMTIIETDNLEPPDGVVAGRELVALPAGERPDGVLGVTDLLAMSVIGELTGAGLRVPGDVKVIGCDYNAAAWGGTIPVSSVALHGDRLGEESVALLMEELAQNPDHVHRTITVEPTIVVRESTVGRQLA